MWHWSPLVSNSSFPGVEQNVGVQLVAQQRELRGRCPGSFLSWCGVGSLVTDRQEDLWSRASHGRSIQRSANTLCTELCTEPWSIHRAYPFLAEKLLFFFTFGNLLTSLCRDQGASDKIRTSRSTGNDSTYLLGDSQGLSKIARMTEVLARRGSEPHY